jgi:hypothetical protein
MSKKAVQSSNAKNANAKSDNQQKTLFQCWKPNSAPKSSTTSDSLKNKQSNGICKILSTIFFKFKFIIEKARLQSKRMIQRKLLFKITPKQI